MFRVGVERIEAVKSRKYHSGDMDSRNPAMAASKYVIVRRSSFGEADTEAWDICHHQSPESHLS